MSVDYVAQCYAELLLSTLKKHREDIKKIETEYNISIDNILEFINNNTAYLYNEYFLHHSDIEKYFQIKSLIESRHIKPTEGDIVHVICNSGKEYIKAHLEENSIYYKDTPFVICTEPYVPFIDTDGQCCTSGGYWIGIDSTEQFQFISKQEKVFHTFGWQGPRANGAFKIVATVNKWEYSGDERFY